MKKLLLLFAFAFVAAACQGEAPISSGEVELDDFYIEPASTIWAAGPVEFEVFNEGEFAHSMVLTTEDGETVVTAIEPLGTDEVAIVDVDLPPGNYVFTCRIVQQMPDGSVVDHFERGMSTTISVVEG